MVGLADLWHWLALFISITLFSPSSPTPSGPCPPLALHRYIISSLFSAYEWFHNYLWNINLIRTNIWSFSFRHIPSQLWFGPRCFWSTRERLVEIISPPPHILPCWIRRREDDKSELHLQQQWIESTNMLTMKRGPFNHLMKTWRVRGLLKDSIYTGVEEPKWQCSFMLLDITTYFERLTTHGGDRLRKYPST
jgi:hypothetical protein